MRDADLRVVHADHEAGHRDCDGSVHPTRHFCRDWLRLPVFFIAPVVRAGGPGDQPSRLSNRPQELEVMDIVDAATRSRYMAGIKGSNTRPELVVRSFLHATGLRFRLGGCGLPGRPDIVFAGRRVAVFVHGCFWHRHPNCRFATTPGTRPDFWQRKFIGNVVRDARAASALATMGWTSLTIWECESRSPEQLDSLFWQIVACDCAQPLHQRNK